MKAILLLSLFFLSFNTFADSIMRIVNNSNFPVVAMWQAGSCSDIATDPEDDYQFTVCHAAGIEGGETEDYSFGWWMADRSVKIWGANGGERIGFCNSFDDEVLTVTGTTRENQEVTTTSGC